MQRHATDAVSLAHGGGKNEKNAFVYFPLMTRTEVSYNFGIPTSEDNPASGVLADCKGNMSPA